MLFQNFSYQTETVTRHSLATQSVTPPELALFFFGGRELRNCNLIRARNLGSFIGRSGLNGLTHQDFKSRILKGAGRVLKERVKQRKDQWLRS